MLSMTYTVVNRLDVWRDHAINACDMENSESPLVGRRADFEDSRPGEVSGTSRREGAGATTADNRHQSLREPLLGGQ